MVREGTLFILVGPSGAGKNTLMGHVQERLGDGELCQLATYTTRQPRGTEKEGVEHHFVTHEEFDGLIALKTFVEFQRVHGNDYYGTPRGPIEEAIRAPRDLVADIDFLGAAEVRKEFPAHTVIIFVTPPGLDALEQRILNRGTISPKSLADRLSRARFELTYAPQCNYLVVNDDRATAIEDLYRIISSERSVRSGEIGRDQIIPHQIEGQVIALIEREGHVLADADGMPPSFELEGPSRHPYETLKGRLVPTFGVPVTIEPSYDERFDFAPPRYVSLEAAPPQFRLYYCYRCFWPRGEAKIPAGWEWIAQDRVVLPETMRAQSTGSRLWSRG